jgi:hypothetical protein
MALSEILASIDAEIAQLQQARILLGGTVPSKKRAGRPKKAKPAKKKSTMSAEGRKRIADAQRKRWALKKKSA